MHSLHFTVETFCFSPDQLDAALPPPSLSQNNPISMSAQIRQEIATSSVWFQSDSSVGISVMTTDLYR